MSVFRQILGRRHTLARLVAFGLVLGTLAACGQKGPLFLPGESAKDAKTQTPAR